VRDGELREGDDEGERERKIEERRKKKKLFASPENATSMDIKE
jgi:hypothetical protein